MCLRQHRSRGERGGSLKICGNSRFRNNKTLELRRDIKNPGWGLPYLRGWHHLLLHYSGVVSYMSGPSVLCLRTKSNVVVRAAIPEVCVPVFFFHFLAWGEIFLRNLLSWFSEGNITYLSGSLGTI